MNANSTANSTAHLTNEELTDILMKASSLTVNAHLLGCPACASELDRMKGSIEGFRSAAHSWSEDTVATAASSASHMLALPVRSRPLAGWILVAAALVLSIAGATTYVHQQRVAEQAHTFQLSTPEAGLSKAQLDQDNQLLSQVSGELTEGVPAPMQPLLVSDAASSSGISNK